MAGVPLPPQFYEDAAAKESRGPGPWPKILKVLIFLGAALGAAWGVYNYYWLRRLPLDYALLSDAGEPQGVRIMGRSGDVIQYELDGVTMYRGIGVFHPIDQAFLRRLPQSFELQLPQSYTFTDATGKPRPVTIEARNGDWLKYTDPATGLTHYASMQDLPEGDQLALFPLPSQLIIGFPMDYTLPGPDGKPITVRLEGRSSLVVRYTGQKDKVIHLVAIESLTPTDQKFIRQLPEALRIQFPFEWTLTGSDGKSMPATIQGRGKDFVRYVPKGDIQDNYIAMSSISELDRRVLATVPESGILRTPFEHTLTDADGATLRARIEGRSDLLVKIYVGGESAPRYRLLSDFSDPDQALLGLLPANLTLAYPIEATLANKDGKAINVNITGRDLLTVTFAMPPATASTNYSISALSPADQAFVRTLPLPPPRAAVSASAAQIANYEARIAEINKQISDLQARSSAPNAPSSVRQANDSRIRRLNDEMAAINKQLEAIRSGPSARSGQ